MKKIDKKFLVISGLILLFSVFWGTRVLAQSASFYPSPAKGSYKVFEKFSVSVYIKTEGVAINAAQAEIYFPAEKLKVVNVSKSNSIFTLWFQEPTWSNSQGKISFGGGLPSPGYTGSAGKIINISFQGKAEGEAQVNFGKEIITTNDAWGTDVFSSSQGATFTLLPSEKLPPTDFEGDNEPPYPFEITVDNEGDSANPQPLLYFETGDEISGISYYELKIDEGDTFSLLSGQTTPFRLPYQTPGTYSILVRAIDGAGNYTEATRELKIESISVPQITVCPKNFISGEEILYIEGTALPNHIIIISFKSGENLVKTEEVFSNEKGEWSFGEEGLFKPGIYKISVKAESLNGAVSNSSEECIFKTILSGLSIGPWMISYSTLILIANLLLILLLIIGSYLLFKIKKNQSSIERETLDLKNKFSKEYEELKMDIEKELEILKMARGEREISEEEKRREEELLKNLEDVKKVLEKELKDIEKIGK